MLNPKLQKMISDFINSDLILNCLMDEYQITLEEAIKVRNEYKDPSDAFYVDYYCSDNQYLFVDVKTMGTVQIKKEEDDFVVDIFKFDVDDSIATCRASLEELK